jgi:uncharacterized protein YlxP (DUF503 family)
MDLRLIDVHSLKDKRSVVRPIVEGARRRYSVAAAEVAHQDSLREATIGVAVVSGEAGHAVEVADAVERFVWSFPEIQVTSVVRRWLED